jgi:hypothetical protein
VAIGLAVTGLSVAGLSATTLPVPAVAAVTSAGSCTDGGGVAWRSKVTWGVLYKSSDGIARVQVDYAGWTTAQAGVIPTDSEVRSYDGNGKLLQTLTKSATVDYKGGTVYDARNPANPPSTPGRAKITIKTGVDGDGFRSCLVTFVQPGSPVVAAAGDIACAPGSVVGTACQHKAVSDKLLADTEVGTVLALGDLQYPSGTLDAFKRSYAPTWGRLKSKTKPVPGNHEYNTTGAAGYYDYFGAQAGNRSKGYYSFDVGAWHFVALNSERDTGASGAQVAWLKADLRAHPKKCVAAFFHAPRWSSGEHGGTTRVAAFVKELYAANADLMLSGHDHNYERFHPLNPSGVRDDARGIVQIVSGLGGKSQRTVTAKATSAAANRSSYGYSRLVLHAGSADITYVSAVGSYTDSSKLTCH